MLWKIAKIFLDPKTRDKCIVLKNSELHKLCDYFDADDLPEEFGGTCRCENGCLPPVPKHMVRSHLSCTGEVTKPLNVPCHCGYLSSNYNCSPDKMCRQPAILPPSVNFLLLTPHWTSEGAL